MYHGVSSMRFCRVVLKYAFEGNDRFETRFCGGVKVAPAWPG